MMFVTAPRFLVLWLALDLYGAAQEIDTIIVDQKRKQFTILDQVEDRGERRAFLGLGNQRDPLKRRELADVFLAKYSQSWLLAQVYEVAAKASIDLEDYPRALQYGLQSLRLLSENPLLLAPLADVQLQQGQPDRATQTARDALEALDRFGRPASIAEKAWPRVERQLRASSCYVLGKAAAAEGLSATGAKREQLLLESQKVLSHATELASDNPQIAYLLGLVQLALGLKEQAANQFRRVIGVVGPLRERAFEQLRQIYESSGPDPKLTFKSFLQIPVSLESPEKDSRTASVPSGPLPAYAGSDACQDCHSREHSAWEQTGMARMFRAYQPENVIGDFEQNNEFADKSGFLLARMSKQRERHYFDVRRTDGTWGRYAVEYTIGSKWQQAYAGRSSDGAIHVFPIQYNVLLGRWINYWEMIDPSGSERAQVRGFHRFSVVTAYQPNCAPCHTSQLRLARRGGSVDPENFVFREGGVNCEMCHGPSKEHADRMRSGRLYTRKPIDPPVDFRTVNHRDYVSICAQCHMQSALREPGSAGEMNYSQHGDSFFRRYRSRPYTEFSRRAFYKDGRFRETTFIVESFLRSACYRKGQAHCGHCHDPHPADAASNRKSLKFRDQPDRMCLQCHPQLADRLETHTRHPAESEASRCVSCHMPRIMNSLLFQAGTHQIDDTPNAEMTLRFGQQESPNACLLCHSNKDASWVRQRLQSW